MISTPPGRASPHEPGSASRSGEQSSGGCPCHLDRRTPPVQGPNEISYSGWHGFESRLVAQRIGRTAPFPDTRLPPSLRADQSDVRECGHSTAATHRANCHCCSSWTGRLVPGPANWRRRHIVGMPWIGRKRQSPGAPTKRPGRTTRLVAGDRFARPASASLACAPQRPCRTRVG